MSKRPIYVLALVLLASVVGMAQLNLRTVQTIWSAEHHPVAATQATISRTATAAMVHVADCVTVTLSAGTTAPTAFQATAVVRDGTTGAGTIVWSASLAVPATAGATSPPIMECGLNIRGTTNTAMTIEFTAAGGVNTFETVALSGHDEQP